MCHAFNTEHVDPQIQHDYIKFGPVSVDKPFNIIMMHGCEFKFDCKVPHGGKMSISSVHSLSVHIFVHWHVVKYTSIQKYFIIV